MIPALDPHVFVCPITYFACTSLDIFQYGNMIPQMARAATTADAFNAIAEPRRRQILDLLANRGEQTVGVIVEAVGLPQSAVSKHLGVLREVGLVTVQQQGRQRMYKLNPEHLKAVHEWVRTYERFWSNQLLRIKERAEAKTKTIADARRRLTQEN